MTKFIVQLNRMDDAAELSRANPGPCEDPSIFGLVLRVWQTSAPELP